MKIKHLLKQKRGATLTELVVCMALTALFLTAVAMVMSQGYRIYYKVRSMDEAVQVTDRILDKIESELEGCEKGSIEYPTNGIRFKNANGSALTIFNDGGYLHIRYDAVNQSIGTEDMVLYGELDWRFDEKSYMGLTIQSLDFRRIASNQIKVQITVSKNGTGYTNERIIRCYNN